MEKIASLHGCFPTAFNCCWKPERTEEFGYKGYDPKARNSRKNRTTQDIRKQRTSSGNTEMRTQRDCISEFASN